jgi:hypothetical protein
MFVGNALGAVSWHFLQLCIILLYIRNFNITSKVYKELEKVEFI